jgi:hypothetical protein
MLIGAEYGSGSENTRERIRIRNTAVSRIKQDTAYEHEIVLMLAKAESILA